ncbi:MAG: S8 family serine peptidase [Candidatus Aenigmarchaeota archaeon]|nr:S8 family serine peptidase [Candidatus Aenigmarchaeota archaeon]
MGKAVLVAALLLFASLSSAQILVNSKPAPFTMLDAPDAGSARTFAVDAGPDDIITLVHEGDHVIDIANLPGTMATFSVAAADPDLFDTALLEQEGYAHDGTIPVIVTLNVTANGRAGNLSSSSMAGRTFESAKNDVAAFLGLPHRPFTTAAANVPAMRDLKIIDAVAFRVDHDMIGGLASLSAVARVELDRKVYANLADSVPLINATSAWRLADSSGRNLTGANVTIAIIDTGVDYTHPDLGGCYGSGCKVAGGYDFVNGDSDPADDHGHGTHVAATAAGNGTLQGVAPNATIYAYKVLNAGGSGTFSQVISGVERASDPNNDGNYADHLDILSMSLGGSGDENSALSLAVDRAVERGVVAVVAAGNSGSAEGAVGTPGSALTAITVAATSKSDSMASFSSRGPTKNKNLKPDVAAPGVSICAAEWDSAWSTNRCIDTRHVSISGTSMATPHVAGLAALLFQKNRSWSPAMVKSALVTTTKDLGQSVFAQGSGRVNALNASNARMLAFPAVVSFGKVSASNISQAVVIKNIHNAAMAFNISATNVSDGTTWRSIATTNVSSLTIAPQQNATVNLSINSGSLGGTFYGYLNITSGTENYRVPFAFVRLTELTVTVQNGTSPMRPVIILLFDDNLVNYMWAYYWSFTGGTYTFTVPSGNYTAVALGDAVQTGTTYILVGNDSAAVGSNTTITLNLASANNFTAAGQSLDGGVLALYKWQYLAVARSGSSRLSTSMTYLGSSFEGNRTLQISDTRKGGTNISLSFAYIGYPRRTRPSYESSSRWNDDTFTAADQLYFVGWNLTNVTNSTPNVLNFSLSNFGVFNYTYNYPGYDPSINASFDSSSSIFFWISPDSFFDISAWIGTAASLKRTTYVMGNNYGFWHYQYMNYLKSSSLGGDWRSEFGAMTGQKEDDTLVSFTWPYGARFAAGDSRDVYLGTSYLPSFFENSNTTIQLSKYVLRGTTNQSYMKKYSTVTWSSSDGSSGTVYLPRAETLMYRSGSLVDNISNWDTVSKFVGSGSYTVNITLPTAYPLYNITYVDANFTLPSTDTNPPRVASLNASKFFAANGTVHVDFNITDNNVLSGVSVYYSYDRSAWVPLNVTNISTVYNGTVPANQASEVSLKIHATDAGGNSISYRFVPVAVLQKNVLINLAASKANANRGDTLLLTGNIEGPSSNISQVRLSYETDGSFYQYDRSGYARGYIWDPAIASGKLDFRYTVPADYSSATLNISAIFNGTGIFPAAMGSVMVNVNVSTTTPSFSSLLVLPSSPDANDDIGLNVTVTASNGISRVLFESNYTGSWVNYSTTNSSSAYNYTINNLSTDVTARIGYRFHANSTSGVNASTSTSSVVISAIPTSIAAGAALLNVNPAANNTLFCDYTENGNGDVLSATVLASIGGNNTMSYNASSGRYEVNYSSPSTGLKTWTCYASKGNFSSASTSHSFVVSEANAPSFNNVTQPGTVYNTDNLTLSALWTDSGGLDVIVFSSNHTGSWVNYTVRAGGTTIYNASYNVTSLTNRQVVGWRYTANDTSGNTNSLMAVQSFTVQNREPSITLHSNDNNKGFGETWSFVVNLSDADGDAFNASLYATPPSSTQQLIRSISTTNASVSFSTSFNRSYIGQSVINITVSDATSSNYTNFSVTVERDDVTVNVTLGTNQSVQRFGFNTLQLGILVFDTDKGAYVNDSARISWTKDGTVPYDDYADCVLTGGNCSVTLDPDHLVSVGEQSFMGSVLDNNTLYKPANSSQASFAVNGTLFTSVNGPYGPQEVNGTVTFNTTVTDDTSSLRQADEVFLEYKFSNAADWKVCAPAVAGENSEYICVLNTSSLALGFHDIRYTAQKENYTSFNTTVFHQFFVIKVMHYRQRANVTAFNMTRLRAENLNTTLDIVSRSNLSSMDVNLTFNTTNPLPTNLSVLELGKYLRINVSGELESNQSNLSYALIKINYTDEELNQTGAVESSLRIYKFNGTAWVVYDPPVGGVNETENYVWANVTSFSDFAVGGKKGNSVACSSSDECNSGNCAADFDGSGGWCAASGSCAHDYSIAYQHGTSVCDSSTLRSCSSGTWSSTACSSGCSNGACITATSAASSSSGTSGSSVFIADTEGKVSETSTVSGILAGTPVHFTFKKRVSDISAITVVTKDNFSSGTVTLTEVAAPHTPLDKFVYHYTDIALSLPNNSISEAVIRFTVPETWLKVHGLDADSIALYRLSESRWDALETKRTGENATGHEYKAVTPGFSVFAVAGSRPAQKTAACGNGIAEQGEACDTTVNASCTDFGFAAGTVQCTGCTFDTTQCTAVAPAPEAVTEEPRAQDSVYTIIGIVAAFAAMCAALMLLGRHHRKRTKK